MTRTLIVCPQPRSARTRARSDEAIIEEAAGLARAIALDVAHSELIRLARYRPATLVGKGTVDRLGEVVGALEIGLAIIDAPLSAVQQRNLEKAWSCKVIDRTGLILEIFGERARTKEGQLQVELAALTYQRSRLVRSWTHLERQRGGFGFLGGPGESQLEMDRRLIDERIVRIKRDLDDVTRTRALHRRARRRVPYPVVALVGYTNAGKSTLFNRLTNANVSAKDVLFATLDPTMRAVRMPSGRDIILSDTVGFVSDLPTDLVAAFRATLEEVLEADMIVHVRDVSHPDTGAQAGDVHRVLGDLGIPPAVSENLIEALNKIDRLDQAERDVLREQAKRDLRSVPVSALTGEGTHTLLAEIDRRLALGRDTVDVKLPHVAGAHVAWLYKHGEVLDRRDDERYCYLRVRLDPSDLARFERMRAKGGSRVPAPVPTAGAN